MLVYRLHRVNDLLSNTHIISIPETRLLMAFLALSVPAIQVLVVGLWYV
jgi:hypothetical protein